jgi:hypothetical protein
VTASDHRPAVRHPNVQERKRRLSAVERDELERALDAQFGGSATAVSVVTRQARDLADSGLLEEHFGEALTVEDVVSNLADAPAEHSLVERWNWWMGALETAHGGYSRFRVRPDVV